MKQKSMLSAQLNERVKKRVNSKRSFSLSVEFSPDGQKLATPKSMSFMEWLTDVYLVLPTVKKLYLPNGAIIDGLPNIHRYIKNVDAQFNMLDGGDLNQIQKDTLLKQLNEHDETINYLARHCKILGGNMLRAIIKLIEPDIDLFEWQAPVTDDKRKIIVLSGGRGRGASTLAVLMILGTAMAHDGVPIAIIRKAKQFTKTVFRGLKAIIEKNPLLKSLCHIDNRNNIIRFTHNKSIIYTAGLLGDIQKLALRGLGALDNPGGGLSLIFAEEARDLIEQDFNLIMSSLRDGRMGFVQLLLATNPGAPTHWINQLLIEGEYARGEAGSEANKRELKIVATKTIGYYPATVKDNPTYKGTQYEKSLENLTGVDLLRDFLGQWEKAGNLVYAVFDPNRHVLNFDNDRDPFAQRTAIRKMVFSASTTVMVIIDGSRGTDPVSMLWVYIVDVKDSNGATMPMATIYREIHQVGIDEKKFADIILSFDDHNQIKKILMSHETPNETARLKGYFGDDRVQTVAEAFSKENNYNRNGQGYRVDMIKHMRIFLAKDQLLYIDGALVGYSDSIDAHRFLMAEQGRVPDNKDYLKTLEKIADETIVLSEYMVEPDRYDSDGRRIDRTDRRGSVVPARGYIEEINAYSHNERGKIQSEDDHAMDTAAYLCLFLAVAYNQVV